MVRCPSSLDPRQQETSSDSKGSLVLSVAPDYQPHKALKSVITAEDVTLKSGLITFDGDTLDKICDTGRVTTSAGKRTVKVGGVANASGKSYALCFHHKDAADGDKWVTIVGLNLPQIG